MTGHMRGGARKREPRPQSERETAAAEKALRDAADGMREMALRQMDECGPHDARGGDMWDAASWLRDRAARIERGEP